MTVSIEVPYFATVPFIPKGKRNYVQAAVCGTTEIGIPEVSASEAPVVVSWEAERWGTPVSCEIRFFGECYYSAAGKEPVSSGAVKPEDIYGYSDNILSQYRKGEVFKLVGDSFPEANGRLDAQTAIGLLEQAKEEVVQSAKNLLIVDGILYRKTELPRILAKIDYRFHGNDVIEIHLGTSDHSTGAHGMEFAIEDFESALAWAENRAAIERRAEIRQFVQVDVRMPELVDSGQVLQNEALRICSWLMSRDYKLAERSDEFIHQWMSTRRALEAVKADPSDDNISDMLQEWDRFFEAYEADETERLKAIGSTYYKTSDIHYLALAGLREVWNQRPIKDEEFLSPKL